MLLIWRKQNQVLANEKKADIKEFVEAQNTYRCQGIEMSRMAR